MTSSQRLIPSTLSGPSVAADEGHTGLTDEGHTGLSRRTLLQLMAASAIPMPLSVLAQASTFPTKPIRMVTPFPAGASTDALARAVAAGMTKQFGQQILVDTKAGAGGSVAAVEVKNAPPDGYTFLLASAGIVTMNQSVYKKLAYDPIKDFAPLTIAVKLPILVICHPSRPYKTLGELITYAKANPGKVTYGSAGTGTSQHMAGELFKSMAHVDLLHIPYKGGAPAMTDLLGGQVDLMFVQVPSGLPHVKANKVRPLAVGSPKRAAVLPDLPTVAESGVPGYDSDTWYGFVMPAGVPQDISQKLYRAIASALKDATPQLEAEGFVIDAGAPAQMGLTIKSESAKWAKVIKEAKIELD